MYSFISKNSGIPLLDLQLKLAEDQSATLLQQKTAEQRLSKALLELDQIFNSTPDGILVIDSQFRVLRANETLRRMLSLPEDLEGKRCSELFSAIPGTLCGQAACPLKNILTSRQKAEWNLTYVDPQGQPVFLQVSANPFVDNNGKILGLIETFRDITARKMAENRYSALFEELKEAVISNKPEGVITDINSAGVALLGFSEKADVLGKNIADFYCDRYDLQHFMASMKEHGYVKDLEIEWKTRDGQKKVVLITSTAVRDVSGRIAEYRGIVKDVTERVRDQNKLMKMAVELSEINEKLKSTQITLFQQEKLASIGQLSAGLAHEINNPLGFVKSNFNSLKKYLKVLLEYTDLLEQGFSSLRAEDSEATIQAVVQMNKNRDRLRIDFISKDLKELLSESEEGFSRIMSTIQGMKHFSRIDYADRIAEYDLNDAIETTLIVARNELKYVARVEKSLGHLPAVECRADEINQVLLNIIINAAQALKDQHREEQGLISISTHSAGNQVISRISDNGPGIPEEFRHRIFDPFFTTKPVGQGTGLGLSISYEIIVNGHGGELSVDSTTDGGTLFTIKLPVRYMRDQVAAEALGE